LSLPSQSQEWTSPRATLRDAGVKFCALELKDPVKDKLKRFGLFNQVGRRFTSA
jgi:hypothetical protein